MADRQYRNGFYTFEKQLVALVGKHEVDTSGAFASLVNQGLTYTAVEIGAAGNDITIALIDPSANNESLAINVTGTDIVVTLATDGGGSITTTATQLQTALAADPDVTALVTVTGTGGSPLNALAEDNLENGADYAETASKFGYSLAQIGTGEYRITLEDKYTALLGAFFSVLDAGDTDKVVQVKSETVATTKLITFKVLAGSTPTNLAADDVLYVQLNLRNSTAP